MSQRAERVGGEIAAVLGDILAREGIKDPRVRRAGLVTITRIEVSGDLRHAVVLFTVFQPAPGVAAAAEAGLTHAAPFLQREIGKRLRLKAVPQLRFTWDRGYDGAARVDAVLREIAETGAAARPSDAAGAADGSAVAGEPEGTKT